LYALSIFTTDMSQQGQTSILLFRISEGATVMFCGMVRDGSVRAGCWKEM